jgi:uncharacterized protein (DUF983 family)
MEKVMARKKAVPFIHIFLETGLPVCVNCTLWQYLLIWTIAAGFICLA